MKTSKKSFLIKTILIALCFGFLTMGFLTLNLSKPVLADAQSEQAVAKIGDTAYSDLKLAFSDLITNGGTLEFVENVVVDLSNVEDWGDISCAKQVIIEGNGATIIGLNRPLIMNVTNNTTIKNLTIQDSNIQGLYTGQCNWDTVNHSTAGAFFGFSMASRLENCHLLSSTVVSKQYCGGLIGYTSGRVEVVNCSVNDSTISGNSSTGGMIGHSNGNISVSGTVSGNTITSNDANAEAWQGVVFGVLTGGAGNTITVIEENRSSTESQTAIQVIGGRLTDVEFVGGSYFSNPIISGPNEHGYGDATFSGSDGVVVNPDGSFTVEEVESIVTILGNGQDIDDKNFSKDSLKTAFEQVMANGGTLEFVKGVEIDLSLINWENMTTSKEVVINGNGATITGLNKSLITNALSASNVSINNLTIKNSNIEGYQAGGSLGAVPVTGAFVGYAEGEVTLNNCKTESCTITSDDYAGGLIAYACSGNKKIEIIDCSVLDSTIIGEGVGGMLGHATGNIFISGTVSNNTITSTDKYQKEGSVVGTINASDGSRINVVEKENSEGTLTTQNGTELYPVGRLYNSCTYLGGSYFSNPTGRADGAGVAVAPYIINRQNKYVIATAIIDTTDDGEINGNYYTSLDEAIENATAGQTITLWQSVTEDFTIDKNITIDLGSNTLNGKVIMPNEVSFTIKGTSTENNIELPTLIKEGYIFLGWFTDISYNDEHLIIDSVITTVNANGDTVYAGWAQSNYVPKEEQEKTVDFGYLEWNYSLPDAKDVTFVYTGTPEEIAEAEITAISKSEYFDVTFEGCTASVLPKIGLDLGKYEETFYVTMHDNSTNIIIAKIEVKAKNISNAIITLGTALTYNGSEQTQTITSVLIDGLEVDYTVSGNTATNVKIDGNYTLTVTGKGNFTGTVNKDWNIAKATYDMSGITFKGGEFTYSGNANSIYVNGQLPTGVSVDYTNNEQVNATTSPITVTAKFTGDSVNYNAIPDMTATIVVNKKDVSGAEITLGTALTYNGREQTQTIASVIVDGLEVDYTVSGNKGTNVGTSKYTLTVTGKGNFCGTESKEWNIAKATYNMAGISFENGEFTYSGNANSIYISGQLPSGVSVDYVNNGQINATTSPITVTAKFIGDSVNYNVIPDMTATITVNKANAVIDVDTTAIVKTYGESFTLPIATTNFGTVICDKKITDLVNADTYTVTYTVAGTNNYNGATETVSVTINKAKVEKPTADTNVFTYTGSAQTYAVATNNAYTVTGNTRTDAGSQTVTVSLNDTANYEWTDNSIADVAFTFTIGKANAVIDVDTTAIVKTYGESFTLPVATTNFGTVVCDREITDLVNAGTYTVTYTVVGTDNYNSDAKNVRVTINKATFDMFDITFVDKTVKYDGQAKSIEIDGLLPDGVTVEYANNGKTDVGVYTVTANFIYDTINYNEIQPMTATLTINIAQMECDLVNENGKPIVIVTSEKGFAPDVEIVVSESSVGEPSDSIKENEKVSKVFDIMLKVNGNEIQPNENITIKLLIPTELKNKEFRLIHNHEGVFTDVEYTIDGDYAVFTVSELSDFLFVYDNTANLGWLIGLLAGVAALAVVSGIVFYIKLKKKQSKNNTGVN